MVALRGLSHKMVHLCLLRLQDALGNTPLLWAVRYCTAVQRPEHRHAAVVATLLARAADPLMGNIEVGANTDYWWDRHVL